MKKLVVFVSILLILFGFFLYLYFHAQDYSLEYKVNEVDVKESYHKEKGYYQFVLSYKEETFSIIAFAKYKTARNLISQIEVEEEDDLLCLVPTSSKVDVYPVCKKENQYVSYYGMQDSGEVFKYEGFGGYNLNGKTYLLWNYHSFVSINDKTKEKIVLFDKDVYNLSHVLCYENYLIVPNYDSDYSYDKLMVIDTKKNKAKEIKLRYSVSFDSYFLGGTKNLVYLYDKKQEQEYYVNIEKRKIYKTSNKILVNGNWEKVSDYKLKEGLVEFSNTRVIDYQIIDDQLYSTIDGEYKTKITDIAVKQIVKKDGLGVYFIHKDTLYFYHPSRGIEKVLSYSEWEFNYNNMIFVFD